MAILAIVFCCLGFVVGFGLRGLLRGIFVFSPSSRNPKVKPQRWNRILGLGITVKFSFWTLVVFEVIRQEYGVIIATLLLAIIFTECIWMFQYKKK